jgi:hypothetical protein
VFLDMRCHEGALLAVGPGWQPERSLDGSPEDEAMLPNTPDRVPEHTSAEVNSRIARSTAESVRWHARHPERIEQRLRALDREWDIERTLEANAATLALTGAALGIFVDKRFLALPATVAAFLLQHAIQGWCPPVPFFRKRGVRTMREIDEERYALKTLRGDFGQFGPGQHERDTHASHALQAARL